VEKVANLILYQNISKYIKIYQNISKKYLKLSYTHFKLYK